MTARLRGGHCRVGVQEGRQGDDGDVEVLRFEAVGEVVVGSVDAESFGAFPVSGDGVGGGDDVHAVDTPRRLEVDGTDITHAEHADTEVAHGDHRCTR